MKRMDGKVVVITGASSGIGKALANHLAAQGAKVYGTSRKAPDAAGPGFPRMIRLDVCSDESASQAVGRVMETEGRIDILINNAGFSLSGAVEDVSSAEALRQFLLKRGAENLLTAPSAAKADLIPTLYEKALGRKPTGPEFHLASEMVGQPIQPAGVEDLLWSVAMLPEFQLIY